MAGVTQMSGYDLNHWGLESSRSFLTHNTFDTCTGMMRKLISAESVDWGIRRLLHGTQASSQYSSLRIIKILTRWLKIPRQTFQEQGGNFIVFYLLYFIYLFIVFYDLASEII